LFFCFFAFPNYHPAQQTNKTLQNVPKLVVWPLPLSLAVVMNLSLCLLIFICFPIDKPNALTIVSSSNSIMLSPSMSCFLNLTATSPRSRLSNQLKISSALQSIISFVLNCVDFPPPPPFFFVCFLPLFFCLTPAISCPIAGTHLLYFLLRKNNHEWVV